MRRSIAAVTLLVFYALVSPAIGQKLIPQTEGLKHIGEKVRVRFTVQSIGRSGGDTHVLNSAKAWNAPGNFQVRISAELHEKFISEGIERPAFHFVRKPVEVVGTVRQIRPGGIAVPAIELISTTDLRVVPTVKEPTPKPTTTSKGSDKTRANGKPIEIEPEQGLKHIGKLVKVRLTVNALGKGAGFYNLNSGNAWDEPGNLQIRLSQPIFDTYVKQGIEKPPQHFYLKQIDVTGIVREVRPSGIAVAAIDLQSVDDLKYVLQSSREAPPVSELIGRQVDLYLRNGSGWGDVVVTALELGEARESLKSLKVKVGEARPRSFRASSIEEIVVEGVSLGLKLDRRTRELSVDTLTRESRQKEAEETERRVLAHGKRIWPRVTDDEHADWIAKHREFAESVQKHFPELPLRVIETKYYVIVTDIPDVAARKYLGYLDTLYDEMCRAFGIPLGSNIWCGKCVVVAFQNRPDFIRFEIEMMKNMNNPQTSGGICHGGGTGRVVISLFKGDFEARFATVLVHETSHGIVHRILSDIRIPSWLNEGMAVWIAGYVVKDDDTIQKSQRKSIAALRQQQTLSGFFDGQQIVGELYGCGSAMVDLLIRRDSKKFREFFTDIKKGYAAEEALQRAYDMNFTDLAQLYGRSVGLPNLRP